MTKNKKMKPEELKTLTPELMEVNGFNVTTVKKLLGFIKQLYSTITETYLEEIKTPEDIKGHFDWCYNKTTTEFIKKNKLEIDQDRNFKKRLEDSFLVFFYNENKDIEVVRFYEDLLDVKIVKYDSQIEDIIALVKFFSNSFKIKNA